MPTKEDSSPPKDGIIRSDSDDHSTTTTSSISINPNSSCVASSTTISGGGGGDTTSGSSAPQGNNSSAAMRKYCRVSLLIWWFLALTLALSVYFTITRIVLPLVVDNHHEHRNNNNHNNGGGSGGGSSSSSPPTTSVWFLALVIGLSCAVSTAIPGLFTVSCIASGFALGFGLGSVVAVFSVMVGLTFSFEGGRTLFRERASALVAQRFPSAQHLSSLHPTKAVWVSWFFPVPLAIKIFFWASCSQVSLARFMASVVAVAAPHISTLCFIGDQATALTEGKAGVPERLFFGLGVASVALAGIALSRWAQKTVNTAALEKSVEKSFGMTPE